MEGSVENEKDETTIAERALRDGARCWDDAWCDLGIGCGDVSGHGRAEDLRICHAGDGAEHWLVAEGDVTIDGRVAVAGDVSLILADGATLVIDGGIDVPAGAGFTIYAQSDGDNQGILEAYGEEFSGEGSAGIGGNEEDVNFGDIVICGGLIYAEGGSRAAGIGGGGLYLNDDVVDGAVSIVDGDVYALGGQYAAGIGSGADSTNGSVCAIYDGKVVAASVLYRLEGGPEAEDAGFSDVSADAWYADAVNWAASVGVVAGYGDAFGANDAINREQLAAILCNYAAYKGEDVSSGAALDGYSDAASVSDWAGESVEWAVAEGLLSGVTNNELAPQGSATRAQVAAMLQRFNAR